MIPEEILSFEITLQAKHQIVYSFDIVELIKKKKGWKRLNALRRAQLVREAYILGRDNVKAEKNRASLFALLPKHINIKGTMKVDETGKLVHL